MTLGTIGDGEWRAVNKKEQKELQTAWTTPRSPRSSKPAHDGSQNTSGRYGRRYRETDRLIAELSGNTVYSDSEKIIRRVRDERH